MNHDVDIEYALFNNEMDEKARQILDRAHLRKWRLDNCKYDLLTLAGDPFDWSVTLRTHQEDWWRPREDDFKHYVESWKRLPLHMAAGRQMQSELESTLAAGVADVHAMDEGRRTALFFALTGESVKALVNAGAEIEAADYLGQTALSFVQSAEALAALVDAGADFETGCGSEHLVSVVAAFEPSRVYLLVEAIARRRAREEQARLEEYIPQACAQPERRARL